MDFNVFMYYVFGIVAIAGAIVLLFAKHPLRGAMGLLTTMLALAGMYALLHAHSIAAFQVIIYGGAIMVLIIYFIMLLDIKSEDYIRSYAKLFWIGGPVVIVLVLFFLYKLYSIIAYPENAFSTLIISNTTEVAEGFGGIKMFSNDLLTNYLFAFEYVSTLLFAAIVAVISIVQLDWKGHRNE